MNATTRNTLIGLGIIIVIALGYFAWTQRAGENVPPPAPTQATSTYQYATTTAATSTATFQAIPLAGAPQAPDYSSALACTSGISSDDCVQLQAQAKVYTQQIAQNVQNALAWINLGTVREVAGDYTGAEAAWTYVAELFPSNPTAFDNLGDLYLNYLHNNAKAEADYLTSIKLYPTDTNPYKALAQLYASGYGAVGAEATILKQGITANPQAVDLEVLLARYYKSQGDNTDAKAEYQVAIENAQSQGLTQLVSQIQTEEASVQ